MRKAQNRGNILLAWGLTLAALVGIALSGYAQVQVEDLGYWAPNGAIEPGDAIAMDHTTLPAMLGSGVVVMQFRVTDLDPLADDPSDVTITGMVIHNLGTANENDIIEVMCMDEAENAIAPVAVPGPGPNPNITFEAFCDVGSFVIPDDGSELFQIAVRTADTTTLSDDDQGNTLMLRVTIEYTETVGSPPSLATFTTQVVDGAPEFVWNGGINTWTDDTYVVNPLMPGEQGVVSRFTVCDSDSNEHNLVISGLTVRQGDQGTALYTDIAMLKVFRVENNTRTMVGTLTPDVAFDRGGPGNIVLFANSVFLQDDSCTTFEVEAQVSPFAFKGKLIQLEFQIHTEEPVANAIDPAVDPEVRTRVPTVIGKGVISIADTILMLPSANIPVKVAGIPLPGLGTLQVGPSGAFTYDPSVIRVKDIVGVGDYIVEAKIIDNRRGEARFTVRIDPAEADNALQNGTIAYIQVEQVGNPGDRTRLGLVFDQVTDSYNNDISVDVGVDVGELRIVPPGDLNGDGRTTLSDALLLANELIQPVPCAGLTDEQRLIADVAPPFAAAGTIPTCDGANPSLTSADVAEIARLSITEAAAAGTPSLRAPESRAVPLRVEGLRAAVQGNTLAVSAQGQGIAELSVEVFNLAGRRVLTQSAAGEQLKVRLQSQGQPLANGVYLYVVTIKGQNGDVLRSEVRKLVVLR